MSSARQQTAVCILGPHRCGTSLTARVLNFLGVDLGPKEVLMPADSRENPKGFWEHQELSYLNDAVLATMSPGRPPARHAWKCPPPLAAGWERSADLGPLRHRARALLRQSFANAELWGWKDPRTCLTLPFWEMLVPQMRFVVCVRNPLDAAQSLVERDGLDRNEAIRLWTLYLSAAISATSARPRVFVSFEEYFDDWRIPAARLARFVNRAERLDHPKVEKAVDDHVESQLWHHRTAFLEAMRAADSLPAARSLYSALEMARRAGALDEPHGRAEDSSPAAALDALASALRLECEREAPVGASV